MRKFVALATGLVALASLSACIGARNRPDEFAVSRQRPLVVPPDFALVPPQPGAAVVNQSVQGQALEALFGGTAPRSAGESATIGAAAANGAPAAVGIRSDVADPGTTVVDKGSVTRDIVAAPEGDGQDARAATTPKP
ncbi:MAG: DUF3035 domain-containing protein [Pseudomonadota bacterium]